MPNEITGQWPSTALRLAAIDIHTQVCKDVSRMYDERLTEMFIFGSSRSTPPVAGSSSQSASLRSLRRLVQFLSMLESLSPLKVSRERTPNILGTRSILLRALWSNPEEDS